MGTHHPLRGWIWPLACLEADGIDTCAITVVEEDVIDSAWFWLRCGDPDIAIRPAWPAPARRYCPRTPGFGEDARTRPPRPIKERYESPNDAAVPCRSCREPAAPARAAGRAGRLR